MTRTIAAAAVALVTLGVILALITDALLPPVAAASAAPPLPPALGSQSLQEPHSGFLAALVPGAEISPEAAAALEAAADRVCEGLADDVPVVVMVDTLAAEPLAPGLDPLTPAEARALVDTAGTTVCAR